MAIRKIDTNIGTVSTWGDENFDVNVHENFTSLKEIVPQVNNSIDDMNVVIEDLNSKIGTVDNSVVIASQAKVDAVAARDAAIIAKNEAQSLYDNFDDRYLGPFLTPPTLDNDGQPLRNGALYYLYTESPEDKGKMYIYDLQRTEWIDISYIPTLFSNLTDILLAGLETGDILKYNKTLGKWQNIPRDYYDKTESNNLLNAKANIADVYKKTEIDNAILIKSITGTATFTNSSNNLNLTGIGSIGIEIGDVVEITGSISNNGLYTAEIITDANNIVFNYEHRGQLRTTPNFAEKAFINETSTTNVTVTIYCKAKFATLGLGQGWVSPTTSRVVGATYPNPFAKRSIKCAVRVSNTVALSSVALAMFVNGKVIIGFDDISPNGVGYEAFAGAVEVPPSNAYKVTTSQASIAIWQELR